jgi:hypothetical protein
MLSPTAGIEEVLWHFAHFEDNRRITLQDNPHFYSELPTSPDDYTGQFKAHPIEYFVLRPDDTIYALVDQPRRVFLDTRRETRIFGNVFTLKDVIIFKGLSKSLFFLYVVFTISLDVHGVLEGESVVGESILDVPNLWRSEKFFVIPDSNTLAYDLRLHPIITTTPTAKSTSGDRRDLLRGALGSSYNDLYIYVGQLPPLWTFRENLHQGEHHVARPSDPVQVAPTSERPGYDVGYATADRLNGDVLLKIFELCRLDDEENWNLQLRWCTLSHVCRTWRHLIHQSSFYLNMQIYFTNGALPLDMLAHLPPLPLVIDYWSGEAAEVDTGLLHAIQQRDRIRRIVLRAPAATLSALIVPMDEPFTRLETLSLFSRTESEEGASLVLPRSFLAPNLRHLELRGIYLPTGLSLLTSTHSLVTLKLTDIQAPGYFTPDNLVAQLQYVLQLEEVYIGFSAPIPRPSAEAELLLPPIVLTTLPALRQLEFRGVSAYLESLLSRISTPLLERLNITLFNQLTFTLPHLSHFTGATEGLRHPMAEIIFNRQAVSFVVGSDEHFSEAVFSLHISCMHFDWQIDSATQVCAALVPILSAAEELTIDFKEQSSPLDLQEEVDGIAWHDLLGSLDCVKKLCIGHPFASGFASMMASDDADVLGLLPELQELKAEFKITHAPHIAFAGFLNARQLAGRPVRLFIQVLPISLQMELSPTRVLREKVRHDEPTVVQGCCMLTIPQSGPGPVTVSSNIRATRV